MPPPIIEAAAIRNDLKALADRIKELDDHSFLIVARLMTLGAEDWVRQYQETLSE